MASGEDATKGQVDARTAWPRFLVDPMPPVVLRITLHQEKTAGRKFQSNRLKGLVSLVLQDEDSFFAQT